MTRRALVLVLVLVLGACTPAVYQARTPAWVEDTSTPAARSAPLAGSAAGADEAYIAPYRAITAKIVTAARADHGSYQRLAELTDRIGHRLSGSAELDRAIAWAASAMKADGLDNVHTEKVMVPHWVRGAEDAAVTAPISRALHVVTLGGSIATAKTGLTAPLVVVHDWKELDARAERVRGAIVLYDVAMPAWDEDRGSGYGDVVTYRGRGAIEAAKRGAVAVLIRSVTAHSLATAHTGSMHYDDKVAKIPGAAITVEDAALLARLAADNPVTVHLHLEPQQLPDAESANTIGEIRGRERPDEIVELAAHLDSWDVGQGAHDDGAGVVAMMHAARVLHDLGIRPRRTIRVVLYTNEENGLRGGKAYAEQHAAELPHHVLAVEADGGGFTPRGFGLVHADSGALARMRPRLSAIASLVASLGVHRIVDGDAGADISPLVPAGVPEVGLLVDNRTYFDIHHTDADTLDKVDPQQLADDAAVLAVLVYVVAEAPGRLDAQ